MTSNEDITSLTALVQRMVDESGNPQGFDARAWLDHWLVGSPRRVSAKEHADEQGAAGARLQREDRCLICGRGRRPQVPDQPTVPCAGPARPGIPSLKI